MTVTEQLRQVIIESGETHYRIAKESGVDTRVLDRFVSQQVEDMMGRNIDRLADYFGLELAKRKPGTAPKEAAKKPGTTGKQAKKKPRTTRKRAKKSAE